MSQISDTIQEKCMAFGNRVIKQSALVFTRSQ